MDIWLTYCRKRVPKCSYCKEPIQVGDLMVIGRQWSRSSEGERESRRWVMNFRWHGERHTDGKCCWLQAGVDYLAQHPFVETRGRKQLQLTERQRKARLKILRQRARLVQKLKVLMEAPLDQTDIDLMVRIGSQIEDLKEQIAPLGGVPASWG